MIEFGSLAFFSGFLAGVINSMVGGGTLVMFPTLLLLGVRSIDANILCTIAVAPGTLSASWGYRNDIGKAAGSELTQLMVTSAIGGILGALLLARTPETFFLKMIPVLLLVATFLFMFSTKILRLFKSDGAPTALILFSQLIIAIYGGYFGGGVGILMLALLGLMGLQNIHTMNGIRTILGSVINGIAAAVFIFTREVDWKIAATMIAGTVVGGLVGAKIAKRMNPSFVRIFVVATGLSFSVYFFMR